MIDAQKLVDKIRKIHAEIRRQVLVHINAQDVAELSQIAAETEGDTIYAVDKVSEEGLLTLFDEELAGDTSFVLIAEGLAEDGVVFPAGIDANEAQYRIIVDPIDGTRGLMYDKRSAWILTGIAENKGDATRLGDIFAAVQTEIPTSKQFRSDCLWATRGQGWGAEGYNCLTDEVVPIVLKPSAATSIEHGFAMISRFFPGGKDVLAAIEDELVEKLIGPVVPGKARLFEDQYICSGGQFYELMVGHDRFNADLRPLLDQVLQCRGQALGICCHPYDVCTALIAEEMGVAIVGPDGKELDTPLDTTSPVAWVGYANDTLRTQIEPVLLEVLEKHDMV